MLTHRIAFAALLFTVSACVTATSPEQIEAREAANAKEVFADDPRRGGEVERLCFTRNIDGFEKTTKRAVVVREGRDRFLVETFPGCFDLDWAQSLAFDSFGGCLGKGDRIIAFESAFGPSHGDRPQSCLIKQIYEWDPDAESEDADSETDESEDDATEGIETTASR